METGTHSAVNSCTAADSCTVKNSRTATDSRAVTDSRAASNSCAACGLSIESAAATDAAELHGIAARCFSSPWSEATFASMLDETGCDIRIARIDGTAVGFCAVRAVSDEGELLDIAVLSEHRRCGIGAALLDAGLEFLHSSGAERIFLEVRESNAAAQLLYASRGFTACGVRKRYYSAPTENAVVMVLGANG